MRHAIAPASTMAGGASFLRQENRAGHGTAHLLLASFAVAVQITSLRLGLLLRQIVVFRSRLFAVDLNVG